MPASLRDGALEALKERRKRYKDEARRAQKEIGDPDRITAAWARGLKRRGVSYGLIDGERRKPIPYPAPALQSSS